MQHKVILQIIDTEPHKAMVIEEPPMLLTWRGMYFIFNRKTVENTLITHIYNEVYGCALRAIKTENIE